MHRSHGYETFLKKFLALPARVKDFVREGSEAELSKLHCSIQNPTQRRYHMTSLPANRTQHSGKSDLPFPLYEDFASRWNQLYEADFQTSFFFCNVMQQWPSPSSKLYRYLRLKHLTMAVGSCQICYLPLNLR